MTRTELAWLRLHLTPGLGRVGIRRLYSAFGTIDDVLAASNRAWREKASIREKVTAARLAPDDRRLTEARRRLDPLSVRLLAFDDDDYPPPLAAIPDPPALLYLRGTLPCQNSLAIVGARHASDPGLRLTRELASDLARHDIEIVSGLARGVDTAAHLGALDVEGQTIAVLGCGIDRIYPQENAALAKRVCESGAIISEYPPGTAPLAGHFPARNRIISGLCRGVLIVEAAQESGSLITADFALEQGREVFAVPGAIYSPTSQGVNRLLKEGASLVTEASDILSQLWPAMPSRHSVCACQNFAANLDEDDAKVFVLLSETPCHIDTIARKSGLTPMDVSAILLHLELQGGAEQRPGMHYVRGRFA